MTQFDIYFDMLPGYDTLVFNLVFGSEEYPEWINQYVDGFGLLVDGENIAFIDGKPININHPNMRDVRGTELDGILLNNPNDLGSCVLTFMVQLEPGSTGHTLTFIIADTRDAIFDTTVFISNLGGTSSRPINIDVIASRDTAIIDNLSGVINGVMPGETATFEVEITGTGLGDYFDLQFIESETGALLGTIPVSINNGYFYLLQAIDPDGDTLTYSMPVGPEGATINPETGAIHWNPPGVGQYAFTVQVDDGRGGFDKQTFTVDVTDSNAGNRDPVIEPIADAEVAIGNNVSWQVQASDPDGGVLYYYLVDKPDGMTIDMRTGIINWSVPVEANGESYRVEVFVTDRRGGSGRESFDVNVAEHVIDVNHKPVIMSTPPIWSPVGKNYHYTVKAFDPDNDRLRFSLGTAPSGAYIDENTGELVWRPTIDQMGWNAITVIVDDGRGGVASQFFYLGVFDDNTPPEIASRPSDPIALGKPWRYQVVAIDPDGDPLTYTLDAASFHNGMKMDAATGLLTWTPTQTGKFDVLITVDDGRGGIAYQAFTIEITESFLPPQIELVLEGPAVIGEEWVCGIIVATDPPDGSYTLSLDEDSEARGMKLVDNMLLWTPANKDAAFVKLTAVDEHGGSGILTFTVTPHVKVEPALPPEIWSQPVGPAFVDEEWKYEIIATDPAGLALTYYWIRGNEEKDELDYGILEHQWNEVGTQKITICVENGHGAWIEQTFTLPIISRPAQNDPPIITSVPLGPAVQGENYEYQVFAYDPNGDTLTYFVDQDSYDRGVRIDELTGLLTWTPTTGGTFLIEIRVEDEHVGWCTQTFDLDVIVKREVTIVPPTITSKPTGPAYVGEPWSYQLTAEAADGISPVPYWQIMPDGSKELIPGGLLTWKPTVEGHETFAVRAEVDGAWAEQRFTIQAVAPVEKNSDPPVIRSTPIEQVRIGNVYQYRVVAYSPNGDSLTYSLDPNVPSYGATISDKGVLSWKPDTIGEDYTFTILVKDERGNETVQTFTVAVKPPVTINTPPVITSIPTGVARLDSEYRYQATAYDDDGDSITWRLDESSIPESARGNIAIGPNTGLFTWTPKAAGTFTFKILASDGKSEVGQIITLPVLNYPIITEMSDSDATTDIRYKSQVKAHDPGNEKITYQLFGVPKECGIDGEGNIIWDEPIVGNYTVTVVVTNESGVSVSRQFELRVTDPVTIGEPPELTGSFPASIPVNKPLTYQLTATDPQNRPITFELVGNIPTGMTITSGGCIEWTPTVIGNDVEFEVGIWNGTHRVRYTFTTNVVSKRTNSPPVFTSTPPESATAQKPFIYMPTAADPDGDQVAMTLVSGPSGMSMNTKGEIVWTPSSLLAGRKVSFTVRASDPYGGSVDQVVEMTVRSVVLAPNVDLSKPLPLGIVSEKMSYQIAAFDPQGEKLTYELVEMIRYIAYPNTSEPIGKGDARIDVNGLLTYTPAQEGILGFRVQIVNESGVSTPVIVFPMQVDNATVDPDDSGKIKHAPILNLYPGGYVEAGEEWKLAIDASDPDNAPLVYTLTSWPPGMVIDKDTGEITWTPDNEFINQQVKVGISVSNGILTTSGYFYLVVTPKRIPPAIHDIPSQTATADAKFQVDVKVTNPDGYTLTYSLDNESILCGMSIDQNGRIIWTPTIAQIESSPYVVTVSVSDGRGDPVTREFTINVVADTIRPNVILSAMPQKAKTGSDITLSVYATDNVGVTECSLKLVRIIGFDGLTTELDFPLTLSSIGHGRYSTVYTIPADQNGTLVFEAQAKDAAGNETIVTISVDAARSDDNSVPKATLVSAEKTIKAEGPIDIVGGVQVTPPGTQETPNVSWKLVAISLDAENTIEIAKGIGAVDNSVLGRFDTTMMRNGTYRIELTAHTEGGNESVAWLNVEVEGNYKLGNFNMSFVDFDFQLSGLPITITRTYDTLNADKMGDFGYGWTLDILHYKMMVDYGNGPEEPSPYKGLQNGDALYFVLPDGTKEGFVFHAQPVTVGYWQNPNFSKPVFTALPGTKSTLLYDGDWELMSDGRGGYTTTHALGDNYAYTPFNTFYGGVGIQLRNGTILNFDSNDGALTSVRERSGNELYFHHNGMEHSSGKNVTFERDDYGRISSIIGPDGKKMTYTYDVNEDLVAVTDQSNATVQFTYLTGSNVPEHYLDKVIDPLGRTAARTEYDEQGRIKKTTDAAGKTIEYSFDTESGVQRVTDQLGNTTTIHVDSRGNVTREISPEGAVMERTYDPKGNVQTETQVVVHNGQEIKLTTKYTYDANSNKLTETDARGNITRYAYNQYGQVTSTSSGGVTTYTYYNSQTGLPTSTTDIYGNTTSYGFDARGNLTTLKNSSGVPLISSSYNKYGEVASITSVNGRTTNMDYDNNGDCIATWYTEDGKTILDKTIYDASRRVIGRERWIDDTLIWKTKTVYNAAGQVIEETDQNDLKTEYTYDVRGLLVETRSESKGSDGQSAWMIQRTVFDAAGQAIYSNSFMEGTPKTEIYGSHTEYDKDGRIIRSEQLFGLVIEINDANRQSYVKRQGVVLSSSSTVYNNAGWIVSSTDSYGLATQYVYNVFGETTQVRRELSDGRWLVSETIYDSQGRAVFSTDSHLEGSTDPIYGTKSLYDEKGRYIVSIRYSDCHVEIAADGTSSVTRFGTEVYRTKMEYDSKGRVKSSTDDYGCVTTYEYDHLDRQVKVIQANGLVTQTEYNTLGQVWKVRIINGNDTRTTEYEYDIFGNAVMTTQPDGTTIQAEYNDKGQKISETNQLGQTRYFGYDDAGRLISVTLPGDATYEYGYDAFGNQTLIRDPNGHETRFTYDFNGNQLSRELPDGSIETFEYDDNGRVKTQTSFEGVVTTYRYDDFGRLASQTFKQSDVTETWTYIYDHLGRVVEVNQNGRITTTTFDSQGRTTEITSPEGTVSYGHDEFGRQTSVQTNNESPTYYTYDHLGRLAAVSSEGKTTRYEYDAYGNLARTATDAGETLLVTLYQYDKMNRLTKLTNFRDDNRNGIVDHGEEISQFDYVLDDLGRKTNAAETFWIDDQAEQNRIDWVYDEA
ncbi:MAG: putative Ig domain-containing protein, partial [Planctomycetaceae bacterium]|nr:putative Ig domain-containing protein [Planctomycetaceae bacterium]